MNALWNRGIQAFAGAVERDNKKLRTRKSNRREDKDKFVFSPDLPDDKQLELFMKKFNNRTWDGNLTFRGYKGTFKIEYWIYLESKLRDIEHLRFLSFVDTQVDKEHLTLLGKWLQWLTPNRLELVFKQNELDDQDVEEFVYSLFKRKIRVMKLLFISNPGVFKGNFLSELKFYLENRYRDSRRYYYKIIKNKQQKSVAILRIQRNKPDEEVQAEIQRAEEQINQTYFYQIGLDSCFDESNTEAFEYLIKQCYHDDNLEQLQGLDVSNCFLGSYAVFYQLCKRISTAKGLLTLALKNQPHIHQANVVQALMGDRYDQLRINHLDISDNQKMIEKAYKQFSDNIISESCKSFTTGNTLDQHLPVIVKFYYMTESFKHQIELLKQKSQKKQQIFKLTLKVLDMSLTENYNRHDLIRKFIDNVVCNEYSNVKKLILSNCDIGRLNAYTDSFVAYKAYIKEKINNDPLYKDFKVPLHEIVLPAQKYRMEVTPMARFFNEVVFTTSECVLQIYHLKLISCFRQTNREDGFEKALKNIQEKIQENPNIRYTLKTLEFKDTYMAKFDVEWFKLFLLTPNFSLESLIITTDEIKNFTGAKLYDSVEEYTKTMPENQLHSLKILKFDDIFEHKIELQGFVRSFILNKKMRLEEISISKITTQNADADEWQEVETIIQARDPSEKLSLKKITFGDFSESGGSKQLIKYLVISKVSQIESLHLKTQHLQDYLDSFKNQYQDLLQLGIDPLNHLYELTLEKIKIEGKEAWNTFSSLFIFNQAVTLKSLHVNQMALSNSMIEGIQLSVIQVIENLPVNQAPFSLHTLQITNCELEENDFLTIFLANPLCKVQTLEIRKCKQFSRFVKLFKEFHNSNQDKLLYTFALKNVILEDAEFDDEIFEDFVNRIIFNQERQCVEKLHLIDCKLKSSQIEILAAVIKRVKAYHQSMEFKRYYKLNDLNFGKNPGVSQEAWIKLFDSLQNVDMTGENHVKLIKVEDSSSDEDENQDQAIQNIQQLINKNQLNVFEKIVHAPQIYQFEPPKQLVEVEINMKFEKIDQNFKKVMYFQIIQGLIIFPENKLQQLKLTDLDLDMFVEETRKVTAYMKTHYEKVLQKSLPKIHLQDISLSKVTNQSEDSVKEFLSVFLCNNKIDLLKLTMNHVKQKLISSLQQLAPQKQQFQLVYLDILNCEETLDENQSSFFIKSMLFGQIFPLKSIKMGKLVKLQKPELADLISDIELGKIQVPLEKLWLEIGDEKQYEIYQILLCTMIGSQQSKLRKLVILEESSKFQALEKLLKNLPQHDIKLEKLEFNSVILSVQFIDFLKKIRTTLKSIVTKTINIDKAAIKEVKDAINKFQITTKPLYDCSIKYTSIESEAEFIQTQFIFHQNLQFRNIRVCKFDNEIKFGLNYNFIKYLNLSFDLYYNSSQQWRPENYELLGNKFIYNRESQIEQLVLHQCHMKIDGIKALVKGADNFRQNVAKDKLEQKLKMNLKRINIYYSLYFSEEGFEIFHKNVTYFEYFNIERFEFQVTNYNDNMALSLCKSANEWLAFQRQYKRQYTRFFPLQYWDLGRNEFVSSEQAWNELCDTFLFTDKTPYLSILNIHFMSMTDPIVDMILAKSNRYFNSKSSSYVYPVKKLNYSLNTALTADGWKRMSEEFFFHPKVELEELNLNSTMLDEPQKIYVIRDAVIKKAMTKPNQKLKLHSLICFNLWLKDSVYDYLSPHPPKYKQPFDIPVKIDYNSWKPGWITGIPESFGDFQQQVQSAIYNREQFINQDQWKVADDFRVSQLHQNFIKSFIIPINDYYRSQGKTEFTLNFDTTTLDTLSNIFKYPAIEPGKPYPYNLLFQEDFFKYQKEHSCIITKINVIQTKVNKLEEITQMDIYRLWKNLKSKKTSIDQVFIDYELNDDLIELMYSDGYTEREIIHLIRLFPPSKIRAQNTITIQAIKGIYSIFWDAHNFEYSTLQYDFDNFLNIGIGYALREIVYNSKAVGCKKHLKKFIYALLNIFVKDVKKYVLDHQVQDLNIYLSKQKLFFFLLGFTNLVYFASCIVPPVYFTLYYNYNTSEGSSRFCKGIPAVANYIYYGFAVLSFCVEAWLFKKTSLLLSNHTEYLIDIKIEDDDEPNTHRVVPVSDEQHEEQNQEQQEQQQQDAFKKQITRSQKQFTSKLNEFARSSTGEWINYLIKIGLAQLAKLDLYNDVVFILTCYFCDQKILFIIALAITAFNTTYYFLQFMELIYTRLKESNKTVKLLSTKFINDFFSIAVAGRHIALATILDQVAPFNVSVIPNNFITRFFFPNQAGRSINNSVKGYLFKFSCEDVPQILVQMYFVVDQAIKNGGNLSWSIYLTISVSVFSLLLSFVRFMSIRPSSISQTEFDKLSEQKDKYRPKNKKDLIQNEQQLLQDYCKLHSDVSENISEDHKNNEMDQLL